MVHENNTENKVYQNKNTASESSVNCLPTANIYSIITFTYTLSETALEWVTDLQTTFNHYKDSHTQFTRSRKCAIPIHAV